MVGNNLVHTITIYYVNYINHHSICIGDYDVFVPVSLENKKMTKIYKTQSKNLLERLKDTRLVIF